MCQLALLAVKGDIDPFTILIAQRKCFFFLIFPLDFQINGRKNHKILVNVGRQGHCTKNRKTPS